VNLALLGGTSACGLISGWTRKTCIADFIQGPREMVRTEYTLSLQKSARQNESEGRRAGVQLGKRLLYQSSASLERRSVRGEGTHREEGGSRGPSKHLDGLIRRCGCAHTGLITLRGKLLPVRGGGKGSLLIAGEGLIT